MLFSSLHFLVFFAFVLVGMLIAPPRLRCGFMLVASIVFYMGWNPKYALLICVSIITTYLCGLILHKFHADDRPILHKKAVVAACFAANIAILFFFKYCNFFIENVNLLLTRADIENIAALDVLLPIGISFYTFQALGYIIDVYRKEIDAEKNFLNYALFVTFFPALVAGPIERSKNLLAQIHELPNRKVFDYDNIFHGTVLLLWGLFMKLVIADRVAILVDNVYNSYWNFSGFSLCVATLGFAIQIYCDFASYSTMAIGMSKIMGFTLIENFNAPYLASSISDFWSRWHISLSSWFRDYLYIPLGGNRLGGFRTSMNILIVFLVSGIWHGAEWTFLIWGLLHGLYQVIGRCLSGIRKRITDYFKINTECFSFKALKIGITFGLVCFAWIFFRANNIEEARNILQIMITDFRPWEMSMDTVAKLGLERVELDILGAALVLLIAADFIKYRMKKSVSVFLAEQNSWFKGLTMLALVMGVMIFGIYGPEFNAKAFIYFQF